MSKSDLLHWPIRGHILVQIINLCFLLSCTILLFICRNADSFEWNTLQPTLLVSCKHCQHFSSYNIVDITIIVKHISKSFVIFHVVLDDCKQVLKPILIYKTIYNMLIVSKISPLPPKCNHIREIKNFPFKLIWSTHHILTSGEKSFLCDLFVENTH